MEGKPVKRRGRPLSSLSNSAKKKRKKEQDIERQRSRITIGAQVERWCAVKAKLGLETHEDVACFLLDSFEKKILPSSSSCATSTPAGRTPAERIRFDQEVSDIASSTESCNVESDMSGIQPIQQKKDESSSFLDPFQLTIDVAEQSCSDSESSDDEYEPSINITLRPTNLDLEEVSFEEAEEVDFGHDENDCDDVQVLEETQPGIERILSPDDCFKLSDDDTCLVYLKPLLNLANVNIARQCSMDGGACTKVVELKTNTIGSALYIKWVCKAGHLLHTWCSQPILNRRLHGGDLMLSSSILLSGNNYSKVALFAKFLKLHFVSSAVYLRIQRTYLVPAIDSFWEERQTELLNSLMDKQLIVMGDGRMDSPGHCAQYCSYTIMEDTSKKILSLVTLDKRETEGKSTNMETAGFAKTLGIMGEKGISISEVVTDQHLSISALMKNKYPQIKHSYDIWHAAKNLGKKIIKAGKVKACKALVPWTQHVVNHFWHTAQTAGTYEEFIGIWFGVLHHVVNEHEWVFGYGKGSNICSHGPLNDDRPIAWLEKGSAAHSALRKVVMDKRLLNNVHYFLNFRSSADLEIFHNHILMYAAKRFSYIPPVYRARNLLAAIDYNEHCDRGCQLKKDGTKRYQRLFNKKSARWSVVEIKKKKEYNHIGPLMQNIIRKRLRDKIGMQKAAVMEAGDPRRISRNISKIPPPPTKDLVDLKKSRLK